MNELENLTDEFVSWQKSSFGSDFTLFKLYTRALIDPKGGPPGQFSIDGKGSFDTLVASSDPVGLVKRLIRVYLFHSIKSTGVPMEKWIVEFSPMMERFHVPSHLFLDTQRDRGWLA